jgi:hypothetical protein
MQATEPGIFVATGITPGRFSFTAEAPSVDASTIHVHVTTQRD